MIVRNILVITFMLAVRLGSGQVPDSMLFWALEDVTIVSNKLDVSTDELPERVEVITEEVLNRSSANRLSEILAQLNGLRLDSEFGDGVQMQGLNADYTMILLDGVPLIGRKGGILDLERISVENIERVEILKGPYSTLYGSEALAGVINIITRNPDENSAQIKSSARSNEVYDLRASLSRDLDILKLSASAGVRRSAGYSILPDQNGYTLPPYTQLSAELKARIDADALSSWNASYRFFQETQDEAYNFTGQDVQGNTRINDHIINLTHKNVYGNKLNVQHTLFAELYDQQQDLFDAGNGERVDEDNFRHLQVRMASEADWYMSDEDKITVGAGLWYNRVSTNRYNNIRQEYNVFGYAQWRKNWGGFETVSGMRLEWNDRSGAAITGNLALNKNWSEKLVTGLSIGTGYKLPDYRQKYLSYTNATVGYSIVGTEALDFYRDLQENGLILNEIEDPGAYGPLRSEYSFSTSLNISYRPLDQMALKLNIFRNDLFDLIDTYTVGLKTNGSFVYSYRNFSEIVTQGIELSANYTRGRWQVSGGYQYLDSRDKEVMRSIENGEVFGRDPESLRTFRLQKADYGGLFNRSRHSGQIKIAYSMQKLDASVFLQSFFTGRFGRFDIDGNNVLNLSEEYVNGYATTNLGITKNWNNIHISLGVDNILDFTNPEDIPMEQGRIIWSRITLNFE